MIKTSSGARANSRSIRGLTSLTLIGCSCPVRSPNSTNRPKDHSPCRGTAQWRLRTALPARQPTRPGTGAVTSRPSTPRGCEIPEFADSVASRYRPRSDLVAGHNARSAYLESDPTAAACRQARRDTGDNAPLHPGDPREERDHVNGPRRYAVCRRKTPSHWRVSDVTGSVNPGSMAARRKSIASSSSIAEVSCRSSS